MRIVIIFILSLIILNPTLVFAEWDDSFDLDDFFAEFSNQNDQTVVETNVDIKVNTDNKQTADNKNIESGDYEIKVDIQNEVNGESIKPIHVNINSNEKPESYQEEIITGSTKTKVNVEVNDTNESVELSNQDKLVLKQPEESKNKFINFFQQLFQRIFSLFN